MRKKILPLLLFVATVSTVLGLVTPSAVIASRDFICYWTAAHLAHSGADPYSMPDTLRVEQGQGYAGSEPLIIRNPPPALALSWPLGFLSARMGNIFWTFLIVGSIAVSVQLLAQDDRTHVLAYAFVPVLVCVIAGQMSAFLLPGIVLFLKWVKRNGFAAGAALSIFILKPHVILPFGVVLLLWVMLNRRWDVLWGLLAGVGLLSALATAIRPESWSEYATMMRSTGISAEFFPTPAGMLRGSLGLGAWAEFVPAILGCLWAAIYYLRREWDWSRDGLLLIAVSLFVAPRAWITDEIIVLPAMLALLYQKRLAAVVACSASAIALIELFSGAQMNTAAYAWTSTAWLLSFLLYGVRSPVALEVPHCVESVVSDPAGSTAPAVVQRNT